MRIHEILEACVEYVAIDGVIGTDARALLNFLQTRDSTIDLDFFTHLWTYLIAHDAIQLVLTTHPLPSSDGHIDLGTAPLPSDYDPNINADAANLAAGLRGRAAAMMAQGKEYLTDRETMVANKEAKRLKAAQRYKPKPPPDQNQQQLLTFINEHDGGVGDDRVSTSDFAPLVAKWGSRLRIRATDQEIYFRLTGSHDRVGKITALVLHALQLAARSREQGVTALDLAPAINTTQGSLHHYMKTLTKMGLCVKVPYVRHSTVTNILLFHQSMEDNHIYQSTMRENVASSLVVSASVEEQSGLVDDDGLMADDDEEAESTQQPEGGWNLDFPPLKEDEIYAGHEVRLRLIRILDHPNLRNHLLKAANLLHLIGWQGEHTVRQRRAVAKQVTILSNAGVLDVLAVGESHTRCLRLKKHDPDYLPPVQSAEEDAPTAEATLETLDDDAILEAYNSPFDFAGKTAVCLPLDFQLNDLVYKTGHEGSTLKNIRNNLDGFNKRAIEFHFKRCEVAWTPPQLRQRHITQVMDTVGRERRLKALTLDAYRHYMLLNNLPVDEAKFPALTDDVGHWLPLDNRGLWAKIKDLDAIIHKQLTNETCKPTHKIANGKSAKSVKRPRKALEQVDEATVVSGTEEDEPASKRVSKYDVANQLRGRPRKYIYVVDEEGHVNRNLLDSIFPVEGLAPIWIYIASRQLLVPAAPDYFGFGVPVLPSNEQINTTGKPKEWFRQFDSKERRDGTERPIKPIKKKTPGKKGESSTGKGKAKGTGSKTKTTKTRAPSKKAAEQADPPLEEEIDELIDDNDGQKDVVMEQDGIQVQQPDESGLPSSSRGMDDGLVADAVHIPLAVQIETPVMSTPLDVALPVLEPVQPEPLSDSLPISSTPVPQDIPPTDDVTLAALSAIVSAPDVTTPAKSTKRAARSAVKVAQTKKKGSPASSAERGQPTQHDSHQVAYPSPLPSSEPVAPSNPSTTRPEETQLDISQSPIWGSNPLHTADSASLPRRRKQHVTDLVNPFDTPVPPKAKGAKRKAPTWATAGPPPDLDEDSATPKASAAKKPKRKSIKTALVNDKSGEKSTPDFSAQDVARNELPAELYQIWLQKEKIKQASRGEPRPIPPISAASGDAHEQPVQPLLGDLSAATTSAQAPPTLVEPKEPTLMSTSGPDHGPAQDPEALPVTPAVMAPRSEALSSEEQPPQPPPDQEISASADIASTEPTREATPLVEVMPSEENPVESKSQASRVQSGRFDMGTIRRMAELCQALVDAGGIMETTRLLNFHTAWVKETAGTDRPNAPLVLGQMDRSVYKRTIKQLAESGRVKSTKVAVPTMTGRTNMVEIISMPELSPADFQQYVRKVQSETAAVFTKMRPVRQQIPGTEFTEVVIPVDNPIVPLKVSRAALKPTKPGAAVEPDADASVAITPETRRARLIEDQIVAPALLGVMSGKIARVATMHQAIVNAFVNAKSHVVSTSPRVFSLELLFSEIPVAKWYNCVSSMRHSDELEAYLRDPETGKTKLRDVPANLRMYQSYGGYGNKEKLLKLLQAMTLLKLIRPLDAVDQAEADMITTDDKGFSSGFRSATSIGSAMFFQLYEYAPVYHVAVDLANLLGVVEVGTRDQAESYWQILRQACLYEDDSRIPRMERVTPTPLSIAPFDATFDVDDHLIFVKNLRAKSRWRPDTPLLDLQKTAIDGLFRAKADFARLDSEDFLKSFAWEWALHIDYLRDTIAHRLGKSGHVQNRKKRQEDADQRKAQDSERKQRAEAEFQAKLKEFTKVGQLEWDERVDEAVKRTKMDRSPALDKYLLMLSLTALKKGPFTDEALDAGCSSFRRLLLGDDRIRKPAIFRRSMKKAKSSKEKKPSVIQGRPATRNRKHWEDEEDLALMYGEAIIRGRYRGKPGFAGRSAMVQIFPTITSQVLLNRLKKLWEMPGRKAFFEKLVEVYHELWQKHRGTPELPDPTPDSTTDFDLKAHIAWLQLKVPMNARDMAEEQNLGIFLKSEDLPWDHAAFVNSHVWDLQPIPITSLNIVWELGGDDMRMNALNATPMLDAKPEIGQRGSSEANHDKLKSIIKKITATENEEYLSMAGQELVKSYSNEAISRANSELLEDRVIRKWRQASGGRVYSIHGHWQQAAQGPYPDRFPYDVETLQSRLDRDADSDGFVDWNLMSKGGEIASLLHMVSNNEVEFDFNVKDIPTLKYQNWRETYNTRALSDQEIEFGFKIRRNTPLLDKPAVPPPSIYECPRPTLWNLGAEMVDAEVVSKAVQSIQDAGRNGLTRPELQVKMECDEADMYALLDSLSAQDIFYAGYDTARLVHKLHWSSWALYYHQVERSALGHPTRMLTHRGRWAVPRKWTTIYGETDEVEWERAKQFALSIIATRPGITDRGLRLKVGTLYDRLELNDLLRHLLDLGVVRRETIGGLAVLPPLEATDVEEETKIAWKTVTARLWH